MATIVSDNFDRANSTTTVGAGQVGAAPAAVSGTWGINTNQLYPVTVSTRANVLWDAAKTDVDVRIKRVAGSTSAGGIMVCATSATEGWQVTFSDSIASGPTILYRITGTTAIPYYQGRAGVGVSPTAVLRVEVYQKLLRAWADSTLLLACEIPGSTLGNLHGVSATATAHRFDDLLIQDSAPFTLDQSNLFLYRGRDTKTADQAGGA